MIRELQKVQIGNSLYRGVKVWTNKEWMNHRNRYVLCLSHSCFFNLEFVSPYVGAIAISDDERFVALEDMRNELFTDCVLIPNRRDSVLEFEYKGP
jgi:hypothetical protein